MIYRAQPPSPPPPPPPPPGVQMSKSVNMLGFGQLLSGGGGNGKAVTETELNGRIKWMENTIRSLADEVQFIKHETGPRGHHGPEGQDGRNGLNGVPGKDGRDGPTGKKGKEGEEGAEGGRGAQGATGLSSGGGWTMQIFRGKRSFSSVPDLSTLSYVGSARVHSVAMPNLASFRTYVPETPNANFVWRYFGKVAIKQKGNYVFCTTSADRSRVFVDNTFLLENMQANVKRCKKKYLTSDAMHSIMVDGFNNGNKGGVTLTYQGPDTGGQLVSVMSVDSTARPAPPASHFHLRLWASAGTLRRIPTDFADVVRVGDAVISEVTFSGRGAGTLTSFIKNAPVNNFAWQVWGKLQVYTGGEYRFCLLSADGSKIYIDSELVVDNDGVHSAKSVCKNLDLVPGRHNIRVEGFKGSRSSAEMKLTYSGPDTGGLAMTVRSVATRDVPAPRPSQWLLRVYRGSGAAVRNVPGNPSKDFNRVGEAVLPVIDLLGGGGAGDFAKWVKASPRSDLVYEIFGKLNIASQGEYHLCVKSKDGSKLYADGDEVVSNDGRHATQTRCGLKSLTPGLHLIKAVGFKGDGRVRLALEYQGPDTENKRVDMQSVDASPF